MTLFDIFYKHTNWWYDVPEDGGKENYHIILDEMEACASEYAKELRGIGDRWKNIIEREAIQLCAPNHYSWPLHGERKEWHDMVLKDFLIRIRNAMKHYSDCDFRQIQDRLKPFFGIYVDLGWPNKRQTQKPHPEPPNIESGEIQGSGKETPPEALKMENLPTIYDDEETKQKEQRVFYKAIKKKWMKINESGNGYIWDKTKGYNHLAYMCGRLYCDDKIVLGTDGVTDIYKSGGRLTVAAKLKELFGGVDVAQNRSEVLRHKQIKGDRLKNRRKIDILFEG